MSVSFYAVDLEVNYANFRAGVILEALGFITEGVDFSDACVGECGGADLERRLYGALGTITSDDFVSLVRIAREAKAKEVPVLWG